MDDYDAKLESDLNEFGNRKAGSQRKQRYIVHEDGFWAIPLCNVNGAWRCSLSTLDDGVVIREVSQCDPDYTENISDRLSLQELELIKQVVTRFGFSYPAGTREQDKVTSVSEES